MCGIFGIVNDQSKQAATTVLEGLKKLEYRGYDSWGVAIVPEGKSQIEIEKKIGKIGDAKTSLPSSSLAIGHTRWATHGGVTDANAHPHLDCSKSIAVIHNGIVENYLELKHELKQQGHSFISETDTEVIAHLIEEKRKNLSIEEAVFTVFNMLSGSNAIGVLDLQSQKIIACRNGSPLVIGIGEKEYYLASDVTAFLHNTKKVHFLHDGEAVVLSKEKVQLFDVKAGAEKTLVTQEIEWEVEDAEKGGYPHFLLKEIFEQKTTIPKTANLNQDVIKAIAPLIEKEKQVIIIGCGSACYCGMISKYFFAEHGIKTEVFGAYEFLPFIENYDPNILCIAISQSGETAETIIAAKAAKARGMKLATLVNARGSTLERMSDYVLSVGAGPEIAVASTKAFTAQLAIMYLVAKAAGKKYEEGVSAIKNLGQTIQNWLTNDIASQAITIAKHVVDYNDIFLIGKYNNYPSALEFALKIKETSYIHSEAFASGELKHGVITLIQKGMPCFVLFSNNEVKKEVLSSATELKSRGGHIIGIGPTHEHEFDESIQTPDVGELTVFGNIIVGQLLGYYLGIGRGADPDKPRNLAKSVTVK